VQIVEAISNRHNAFYFIFNILFLLDYQWMFALEKWKEKSGRHLEAWLNVLGESEALSSLAVIQHDHPQWAAPELSCGKSPVKGMALNRTMPVFAAEKMGHPLLGNSCVPNDLVFKRPENILLVTGSNMSGKSTLLRTAGINLVLAFAGTTVCAEKFSCSLMDIHTCMRVSDDLEKNISSFYAELLRIKMIVQAVEEERPVFFLLDEIFKGTNSVDRHAGAKALIKKFSQEKILGMISTHDLELGDLERESPKVKNYHFQEYYVNDRICFDYKLRPGVSKTRNAAFLIKMAGIEIEKD
jgi:DNA mismatch repair ATPase MutS